MAIAALPFILIAAFAGPLVLLALTTIIYAMDWIIVKNSLPSDSPWRGFFVDLFGSIATALFVGLFTGITASILLLTIFVALMYAVLDIFIFSINTISGWRIYA